MYTKFMRNTWVFLCGLALLSSLGQQQYILPSSSVNIENVVPNTDESDNQDINPVNTDDVTELNVSKEITSLISKQNILRSNSRLLYFGSCGGLGYSGLLPIKYSFDREPVGLTNFFKSEKEKFKADSTGMSFGATLPLNSRAMLLLELNFKNKEVYLSAKPKSFLNFIGKSAFVNNQIINPNIGFAFWLPTLYPVLLKAAYGIKKSRDMGFYVGSSELHSTLHNKYYTKSPIINSFIADMGLLFSEDGLLSLGVELSWGDLSNPKLIREMMWSGLVKLRPRSLLIGLINKFGLSSDKDLYHPSITLRLSINTFSAF